jgi:hypothetical protein
MSDLLPGLKLALELVQMQSDAFFQVEAQIGPPASSFAHRWACSRCAARIQNEIDELEK